MGRWAKIGIVSQELPGMAADYRGVMPTAKNQDRKRVSSQKHEIGYTSKKVKSATGASSAKSTGAVKRAKKQLGRSTGRKRVESRAKRIASK
jgi:hypothetical protein